MKDTIQSSKNDMAGNLSFFLTFFTLAWIVYLFPEVINNFFPISTAKWLLAASAFSVSLFENNKKDKTKELGFGDFGIGLGLVIIYIGFVGSFDWYIYKIVMFILAILGFYGTYRGIFTRVIEVFVYQEEKEARKSISSQDGLSEESSSLSTRIFRVVLNIFELLAALATIFEFVGISF